MGREGKLKQVSEFELAAYRKDPAKLYSDLLGTYSSPGFTNVATIMKEIQDSPLPQRIRERALSGQAPLEEDQEASRKQMQEIFQRNQIDLEELRSLHMGVSKDGKEFDLHKSWHCLHFLFTGKSWEPDDSTLGKAIMGGKEIPDVQKVMGYEPARYLTPAQVHEVADALAVFPIQEKAASFDPVTAAAAKV